MIAEQYTNLFQNYLSSDEFINLEDDKKPLYVEGFRRDFIAKNNITDEKDINYINSESEKELADFRKTYNIPRFVPTQEQSQALLGQIPQVDGTTEDKVKAIEDWRDKAKKNSASLLPANKEDLDYHVEEIANSNIRSILAKEDYKPGGAPDWLTDKTKRVAEAMIKPFYDLTNFKESQRFFAKNLAENPEFDQDLSSDFASGIGQLFTQTAISLGETAIGAPELIPYTFATLYGAQYMNDAYQDEMRKSGDETKAFDRAIGSIPAASLDTFSDAFLFHGVGKGVGNFGERFLKATTEAEKRAILKEAVPAIGKEMRTQFLSEGLIGGAGADVASNLGNYYATGDESYLKNASDVAALARSAFVEGTLGAVFGGAFEALGGKQSKENLSGIISSLTLQQTKSEDILKAIQEGDYNKVIEITKGKLITPDQYSELEKLRQQRQQPVSATNSDTAKAGAEALKGRVADLRQVELENLKFTRPLEIFQKELSKDPEANKEVLERVAKAQALFYNEDGTPKPFKKTSEFENVGDINEFLFSHPNEKKGTVKRNEALEAKLQDGSTASGNNVIYINTSEITRNEKRDRFLDNLNFFHILGENPTLQQSKDGRYVTFKGTDGRVYEASPNPKKGYTPIQITDTNQDGKISRKYKILSQVTEVVEKQQTEQPKQSKPQDVQFEQEFDSRLAAERFIEKNKTTVFNTIIISERGKKDRLVYRKTDNNITFPNEKPFNQQTTQQANDKPTTEEEQFFTDSTPTKTDDTTGLKQLFSDLGSSVTKGLYEKIFKELQAGDLSDPVAFHAKEDFDKGLIKSPDDLKTWVDNNYDRKLNETKNKSVAPENTAPKEESIDQTTIDQTADNLNKDKKEEDKVVAPIVKKPRKRLKKKEEIVEEPKVEESKTEEPKQEEPKQEEPKAEEPKTVDEAIKKAESNPQWTLASLKASAEFQREIMRNDPDGQKRKSAQEELRIINDQIKELEQKPTNEKNAESKKLYFEGLKKLLDQDKLDASKIQEDLKNGVITEEDLKDFAIDNEFIYSGNLDKFISDWKTYSEAAQQAKVEKVLTQREQQIKDKVEADRRRKAQKGRIYELARDVGLGRLTVLNSHEELDKKVGVKASATDQAFVVNGHVYMFLDNIIPHRGEFFVRAAERIFKHEVVGHLKMSKVLSGISPEGFKNLVKFLKTLKYQNGESVWEDREKVYTTEGKKPSDEEIVDEIFAKFAEQRNKTSRGLIKKTMNWIRINFLKNNANSNWTQQDIEIIVEEAFHQELNDTTEKVEKTQIAKKAEKAYNSIEEYIINDDKRGTLSAIKKAHKDGLISDGALEEAIRLSKDKDMGAEDLRGSGVLEELTDKFDNNIRYSKSIKSLHLNSSMKGVYGAWITPTGQIDEVPHQDHFGYALEKIGEENATSVDQVYNELYNRGYIRAVNTPDGVFLEGHKLSLAQRAVADFIGINDEKNVNFNGRSLYQKPEVRFSKITPEQDQQYLKAVESGDMKTAQEMVDEAAREAGYSGPWYHGTNKSFNEFKRSYTGNYGPGIYITNDELAAKKIADGKSKYGEGNAKVLKLFTKINGEPIKSNPFAGVEFKPMSHESGRKEGFSSKKIPNGVIWQKLWNSNQLKSADPVTRDDNGNVIPLSKRFDDANNDIRFSKADTYTENFKSWFGDWENNPEESSKVVDEKGEPLVVYHGTADSSLFWMKDKEDFTVFYPLSHFGTQKAASERIMPEIMHDINKISSLPVDFIDQYAKNQRIYPVYLNIRNPLTMPDFGKGHMSINFFSEVVAQNLISQEAANKFTRDFVQDEIKKGIADDSSSDRATIALIKSLGIDGFKYINNVEDKGSVSWVALYPNQIKSAIGNTGEFNPNNPDIRFSKTDENGLNKIISRIDAVGKLSGIDNLKEQAIDRINKITKEYPNSLIAEDVRKNGINEFIPAFSINILDEYAYGLKEEADRLTTNDNQTGKQFAKDLIQELGSRNAYSKEDRLDIAALSYDNPEERYIAAQKLYSKLNEIKPMIDAVKKEHNKFIGYDFLNENEDDTRFSKKDTKQEPFKSTPSPFASVLESMQEDDLSRRQKTAIKQQINNLIKTKLEQKLIIGEKAIINSFRAVDPRFLSDASLTQMLDDLTNFVDTRTRQEEPLESRTPIIELQNRLAAFKVESDLNEFKNYKKTAPGVIFGDFSDYNNNIGQVRALVMEASAAEAGDFENRLGFDDEDINYTNLIEEMQYDVLDRINNDSESINQPFVQARAEVKMTGDPILDRGAEMILNRINQIEKLRNEFILHLVTTDPTDLTKRERRQLYYSLMSLTTDGYPNGIMNFVSNNITNLLKVTEFKFRTPYSTKVSGRVSKLESAPAQIRRLATDDASHQALIQLIAPFREGLFNARRYHETVITPYLEAQFQSIFGVKTLPAKELNKIGIFSHLRQHFVSEKPSEGLKSSIEWLMKSLDNANIYDKTFRDTAEANREYLKGMIDGIDITWKGDKITNELTDDDVRKFHENAKMIIGEKGIAYADAVVKLFDALKPLSKLTTEYSYGRQFDEIVNFVPSMSIIMKGPEGSEIDIGQYRFLTDNKAIRDGTVGYRSINTTGSSVTKDRMRSLNDNRSLILNLNYLADSVGRLAVYDFFTSFERRDIQRILTPRSKEGKMMAEFLGDKEGRLGKSQTLRNALETMWQNVMSQSSYMHPFHSGVNWLTRKFAQSKLSSIHQVFSQTISNTIPFFVQNLANPKRIGNYVKALQFYAKFKAGALNDPILNNTIAKIVFEIQHRHQENWLDKSVNLNDRGMGVEWVKENFPKVYSGLAASDKFIENGLLGMFRISDSLSGVPMMLAEYLSNEQIRLNRPNLQFEDLVYNPETYVRSLDEVERFLGIGDNSRRGEYLTNRNASISLARNLLISFRSFAIGNATNFMAEYQKLTSSDMSTGDKMKSLRYMGGIIAQSVAFTKIKVGVQLMIGQAIMNALKDKDDDKELKELYRRSQNKMSKEERRILDAEISMRQKIRKALEVNKRNEDNRILFINTAKDAASNMFLWTNLDFITEGMIHIGSDKFEEAAFNEIKAGEVKNLQDLIKRNKQYNNKSIVARLEEQLDQLNSQEFLSASFEDRGYGMLGGSFGGTAKGILDAIESASVFFEPKGISAKDMMNIGSALGMSQPDLLKMVRVMDKIQKANDERDEKIKARLQ